LLRKIQDLGRKPKQWQRWFGGRTESIFRHQTFDRLFLGKKFHFNTENFWLPFLVIDRLLSVFYLSLLSEIWFLIYTIYDPFLFLTKNLYFPPKNCWTTAFFQHFQLSRAFHNTSSPNILGDRCIDRPHLKFWGDRHPVPPKSPPMALLSQSLRDLLSTSSDQFRKHLKTSLFVSEDSDPGR